MLENASDLLALAREIFSSQQLPKELALLDAAARVQSGAPVVSAAHHAKTSPARVRRVVEAADQVHEAIGASLTDEPGDSGRRARQILGQLILGTLAERAFEVIYRAELGTDDLQLEDQRAGYNETDYRVLNGGGRPVFRLNIKFHGTLFRNAETLVGLAPGDCFALATYKIHQAKVRERAEVLPYVFAIVSVPGLTADTAGAVIPTDVLDFAALVRRSKRMRKRSIEDAVVDYVCGIAAPDETQRLVREFEGRIENARWRLISATKADRMLRELLFDRVYAVRVNRFAQNYRTAEVDMHFSLSRDLTALSDFLDLVKQRGLHGMTAYLTTGRTPLHHLNPLLRHLPLHDAERAHGRVLRLHQ